MTTEAIGAFQSLGQWLASADTDQPSWHAASRCSGWTNLDLLIHLTCTMREVVDAGSLPDTTSSTGIERAMDAQVEAFRGVSVSEAMADYRRLLPQTIAVVEGLQLPDNADRTFDLMDAGVYPVHLSADSYVFDHYCHLVHDTTLSNALPQCDPGVADVALAVSTGWLVAGITQMSGPALVSALTAPVLLSLGGPGGGTWLLAVDGSSATCRDADTAAEEAAATLSCSSADFMLWGTHRISWSSSNVRIDGDEDLGSRVLDAIHVI